MYVTVQLLAGWVPWQRAWVSCSLVRSNIPVTICYLYRTAVDCGDLTDPINGTVDTSSGTTFNMTATYTCDTGYTLTGYNTRTCGSDGVWMPQAPICNRK